MQSTNRVWILGHTSLYLHFHSSTEVLNHSGLSKEPGPSRRDGPARIRPNRNPGGWPGRDWWDEPGRLQPNKDPGGRGPWTARQDEKPGRHRQREAHGRRRQGEALRRCRQDEELGRLRGSLPASRGLCNGLQALKGGRSLPPPPFPRAGCRSFFGRHWGCCSFDSCHWRHCSSVSHHWGNCILFSLHWSGLCGLLDRLWNGLLADS